MKDAGSVQRTGDLLVSVSRRSLGGLRRFFFFFFTEIIKLVYQNHSFFFLKRTITINR